MITNTQNTCLHFSAIEVYGHKMSDKGQRGINLVALNAETHKVILRKSYDMYGNKEASHDLARDYKKLSKSTIVIASVKDEGSTLFYEEARALFGDIGSKEVWSLGFREAWSFIGIKGQGQFVEKRGGRVGAGVILGYAQPDKVVKKEKEVKKGSTIEVYSAGYLAGKANSYAMIKVDDVEVVSRDSSRRGINLVILNGGDHSVRQL